MLRNELIEVKKNNDYDRYLEIVKSNVVLFGEIYIKPFTSGWNTETAPHHYMLFENILRHKRSITHVPVEHAKSTLANVVLTIWFLINDRNLSGAIISATARQAQGFLRIIKWHLEKNPLLRQDFPEIEPDYDEGWSTEKLFIKRDIWAKSKDPSIMAIGTGGELQGSRLKFLIGDDICSIKNSSTEQMREKISQWWNETVDNRVVEDGIVVLLGTLQNNNDLLCALSSKHYEIQMGRSTETLDEDDYNYLHLQGYDRENDAPLWADQWSKRRHEKKINTIGSTAYEKTIQNNREENVNSCFSEIKILNYLRKDLPQVNYSIIIGFDPAIAKNKQTAEEKDQDHCGLAVIFEDNRTRDLFLVEEKIEHLTFPEQLKLLKRTYLKYKVRYNVKIKIGIESNAYQLALDQFLYYSKLPVFPVNVHQDKLTRMEIFSVEVENGRLKTLKEHTNFYKQFYGVEPGMKDSPDLLDATNTAVMMTKPTASLSEKERERFMSIKII